jgi:ADP-ribosylglycohydrolase
LSVATAAVLLTDTDYENAYREFYWKYPNQGYGYGFSRWIRADINSPCSSFGNGSAMRVNPVGWAFDSLPEVLIEAKRSAIVTHNHVEGIKGAQAVASAIFLARTGHSKEFIKDYLCDTFQYDLDRSLDEIRPGYTFDVSCQGSVPESIIAFMESDNYEDSVRNAVALGGDSDTMACIAGAIAEAYYKCIDPGIISAVFDRLPEQLATIAKQFTGKYCRY